jgi:ABC-type phosphate transport system substrate-binding protein
MVPGHSQGQAINETIRLSASDLLAEYVEAPLQDFSELNGFQLKFESVGSLPALDRLRDGETDLAIVAIPKTDEMPGDELKLYPFAFDAAVLVINEINPLNEISTEYLGGIYGSEEEFNFSRWGELGITGWGNRNIKPIVATNEKSIAFELFKFHTIKTGVLRPSVAFVSESEVEELILSDASTIGLLSRIPERAGLKTLMVARVEGAPAFAPTAENVFYGDYPIRLAFYIAFNSRDEAKVRPVVRALLSDVVADTLRERNLFPLPDSIRQKLLIDLDLD